MGGSLVLLVVLEIVLRTAWGFGNMPLYAASSEWEYMTVPEQSGRRLGNNFYFNRYGMRSEEVDSIKKHVLGLGDSVINGACRPSRTAWLPLFSLPKQAFRCSMCRWVAGDQTTAPPTCATMVSSMPRGCFCW